MSIERILLGVLGVVFCAGAGICFAEPVIVVEPGELNFSAVEGGDNPSAQILYISNSGTGKLEWEIIEECTWLSVTPKKGNCVDETDEIEVSINVADLSIGEYSCEITVTDPDASNSPQIVEVILNVVFSMEPVIELSQTEFEFTAYDSDPNEQFLYIRNGGTGVLNWRINEFCDWLAVAPDWGSSTGEYDEVELNVDITGLAPGEYDCDLTVYDPNANNSPQVALVHLDVVIGIPLMELTKKKFEFVSLEGGSNPENQFLTIRNDGGGVLNWGIETSGSCDWISIGSMSGSLGPDEYEQILLDVDISGLSEGEYVCELHVSAPGAENEPQIVTVELEVIGPILEVSPLGIEFVALEGGDNPESQVLTIVNHGGGVLEWEIETSSTCEWLVIESMNGGVDPNRFENVLLDVDISGLSGGEYICELHISAPGAENSPQKVEVSLLIRPKDRIWRVPEMVTTIQSAIDIAINGETIMVADGVYTGDGNRDINFLGKAITVRSENGPEYCIIDCQGNKEEPHRGFCFNSGEDYDSVLEGITIINGYGSRFKVGEYFTVSPAGGGVAGYKSNPTIRNCFFVSNRAGNGGGVYFYEGSPRITDSEFSKNSARYQGGGIYFWEGNTMITNCIFRSNFAITGGGMYHNHSSSTVSNCTITDNTASGTYGYGGGLYSFGENPTITNSILWANTPTEISVYESQPMVTYCDIKGGWTGTGNIDIDPFFADASSTDPNLWDLHLGWSSPCVDAGDPGFVAEGEVDIDGEPRVMGGRVDMGADEVGEKQADFTRDGRIDVSDLAVLSWAWDTQEGELNWYVLSDLMEDGIIGLDDLAMFVDDWMWVREE